eukprot:c19553_g1_i1 orf=39-1622(-)
MKKVLLENGRPDKPVACPRCHSLNTKFCYFNNYNVKQPRHFCRECQRYWTAGGSLRNVPVGAGRRKHKLSCSNPSDSYGNAPNTSIGSDTNECPHISSFKPYPPSSFKHLTACNLDGKIVQEMRHDDAIAMHGSQTLQKLTTDVALDLKFSVATHGHRPDASILTSKHYDAHGAEKLGFSKISQKRARELTLDSKFFKMTHGHGSVTPKLTSTHENGQEYGHDGGDGDAHDDACDKGAPKVLLSHDGDETPPSHCGATHDMPTSCHVTEHDDSTCCSSVTTALASSSSEAASEPNGSSPTAHTLPPSAVAKPLGLENTPAFWGPLMWPWLWPFCFNGVNSVPMGGGISHVDPSLAAGLGAGASNVIPQIDQAFTSAIGALSASNASHIDLAHASAAGPGFLHPWPYVWNPLGWGSPWNVAWNGPSMGIEHSQGPAQEKQGSICIPKTLRMDRPDEAAHSSILSTLGVTTLPHSPASFFNAFQPRGDVFQPKTPAPQAPTEDSGLHQHSSTHVNPAAQARSVAFQEGS